MPLAVNLTEGKPCVPNGMSQMSVLVMIGSLFCRLTPSVENRDLFMYVSYVFSQYLTRTDIRHVVYKQYWIN
jgi:uncharacterized protein (DUF2225 family)